MKQNLQRLEVFRVIFDKTSISAAARDLGLTQPTVSRHLMLLEEELGLALFHRESGRLEPTAEAVQIHRQVAPFFDRRKEIEDAIELVRRGDGQTLRLMVSSSAAQFYVPSALKSWAAQVPDTECSLHLGTYGEQVRALRTGEIDLGVAGGGQNAPGIRTEPVVTANLVAVMPRDHPLAERDEIHMMDFADHDCIVPNALSPIGGRFHQALADHGVAPRIRFVAHTPNVAVSLSNATGCLTVADTAVLTGIQWPNLVIRPLRPKFTFEVVTLEAEGTLRTKSVTVFKEALRQAHSAEQAD